MCLGPNQFLKFQTVKNALTNKEAVMEIMTSPNSMFMEHQYSKHIHVK